MEFDVEDVLGRRVLNGVEQFRVRWKGFTKADDTWESREHLCNCKGLVDRFLKKQRATRTMYVWVLSTHCALFDCYTERSPHRPTYPHTQSSARSH